MTAQYNSHIINVLIQFYLDPNNSKIFNDRYGTWLIAKNYMDEYFYMIMKSDEDVANIINKAKAQATEIRNSPLHKALEED